MKQKSKVFTKFKRNLLGLRHSQESRPLSQSLGLLNIYELIFFPHSDISAFLFAWKFTLSLQQMIQFTCIIPDLQEKMLRVGG